MQRPIRYLTDQLIDLIRDRILSGAVPPNLPIRQDALAAEFGVSKIPLREVLARLEEEGLVQSHPNRGYFVREMSASEAEEVYTLRLKIEPDAIALGAKRATAADHEHALALLSSLERVTNEHGEGVGAFNRAFHLALIRPTGQSVTTDILEKLHVLSERYVRKHLEPLGRDELANEEHHEILTAWLAGDGRKAAAISRNHTLRTLEDLRVQLAASEPEPAKRRRQRAPSG